MKHFEKVTEENKIILHCIFHIWLRCVLHGSCRRAEVPLLSTLPFSQNLLELGYYSEHPLQSRQALASLPLWHLVFHRSFPTQSTQFQKSSQRQREAVTLRGQICCLLSQRSQRLSRVTLYLSKHFCRVTLYPSNHFCPLAESWEPEVLQIRKYFLSTPSWQSSGELLPSWPLSDVSLWKGD